MIILKLAIVGFFIYYVAREMNVKLIKELDSVKKKLNKDQ